eukprot:Hpha_TRINITY_DN26279_c0_g1::TRINITY_DN26279_c0_g1_i1::g.184605::m.184605
MLSRQVSQLSDSSHPRVSPHARPLLGSERRQISQLSDSSQPRLSPRARPVLGSESNSPGRVPEGAEGSREEAKRRRAAAVAYSRKARRKGVGKRAKVEKKANLGTHGLVPSSPGDVSCLESSNAATRGSSGLLSQSSRHSFHATLWDECGSAADRATPTPMIEQDAATRADALLQMLEGVYGGDKRTEWLSPRTARLNRNLRPGLVGIGASEDGAAQGPAAQDTHRRVRGRSESVVLSGAKAKLMQSQSDILSVLERLKAIRATGHVTVEDLKRTLTALGPDWFTTLSSKEGWEAIRSPALGARGLQSDPSWIGGLTGSNNYCTDVLAVPLRRTGADTMMWSDALKKKLDTVRKDAREQRDLQKRCMRWSHERKERAEPPSPTVAEPEAVQRARRNWVRLQRQRGVEARRTVRDQALQRRQELTTLLKEKVAPDEPEVDVSVIQKWQGIIQLMPRSDCLAEALVERRCSEPVKRKLRRVSTVQSLNQDPLAGLRSSLFRMSIFRRIRSRVHVVIWTLKSWGRVTKLVSSMLEFKAKVVICQRAVKGHLLLRNARLTLWREDWKKEHERLECELLIGREVEGFTEVKDKDPHKDIRPVWVPVGHATVRPSPGHPPRPPPIPHDAIVAIRRTSPRPAPRRRKRGLSLAGRVVQLAPTPDDMRDAALIPELDICLREWGTQKSIHREKMKYYEHQLQRWIDTSEQAQEEGTSIDELALGDKPEPPKAPVWRLLLPRHKLRAMVVAAARQVQASTEQRARDQLKKEAGPQGQQRW